MGPADASSKGDHAGDIDPDRAITAAAEDTVAPDDSLHALKGLPVHLPFLLIQFSQRVDDLVRGHVLRVSLMGHEQEATLGAETAVNTVGEKTLHFLFSALQYRFDLGCIDGRISLFCHGMLRLSHSMPITTCGLLGKDCVRFR